MPTARRNKLTETLWSIHRGIYQITGGRIGSTLLGIPILLLYTRGRKTGKPRTNALIYVTDGVTYAVAASHAGEPRNPAWYHNLRANPNVSIQVKSHRFAVVARDAEDEERERIWAKLVEADPAFSEYERRTSRAIPVVVLEPV